MKPADSQHPAGQPAAADAAAAKPEAAGLTVAVVCQDAVARERAAELCGKVGRLAGPDAVRARSWQIGELNAPDVFREAVAAAAGADVVIVSVGAAVPLPAELRAWIDAWLPERHGRDGSLIALIDVTGQPAASLDQTQGYLRTVARRGGLDFELRERTTPATSGSGHAREMTEEADQATGSRARPDSKPERSPP